MVYFHWKSAFWVRPCLKTSLWRHTLTDFHDFGINGKKRPYPIPWFQTIIVWARQFQVHKGVVTTPLVNHVTKKNKKNKTKQNKKTTTTTTTKKLGRSRVNRALYKRLHVRLFVSALSVRMLWPKQLALIVMLKTGASNQVYIFLINVIKLLKTT